MKVEVLARYYNRPELLRPLVEVLRRVDQAGSGAEAAYRGDKGRARRLSRRRRLTSDEIESLVELLLAGTRQTDLAAKFGISLSGVKWVLRQHGVRRQV
jgi:DNA invertase Pin-like site-specific DNA recombinase